MRSNALIGATYQQGIGSGLLDTTLLPPSSTLGASWGVFISVAIAVVTDVMAAGS